MKISELYKTKKPIISFEIFPPKSTTPVESIYKTIDGLAPLHPDFISVTYGAGGSSRQNTVDIAKVVKQEYNIPVLTHLTCVGATKQSIDEILDELQEGGIQNILALRGDLPEGQSSLGDFKYASDLASYIKTRGGFDIAGACYPEKHIEAYSIEEDMKNLKHKVIAGTDMLVSQLFFDNEIFYKWCESARKEGITVPIVAGIMPITSHKQLERMVSLCGASIPAGIQTLIKAYHHNDAALREAGIAYATMQVIDLLAHGVDGIHLYTMNQPDIAKAIMANMRGITYALKTKRC
ncbi:MAG: methylenetetrahydrofolate reductase [NAD(P)H] [Cellulosilyticaceae bacterium]